MASILRKWWVFLLGLWFILYGLLALTNFRFAAADIVMAILAIAGGFMLWIDR